MTWDSPERRARLIPVEVSSRRVGRVIDSVLDRIEHAPARRPGLAERLGIRPSAMTPPVPLSLRLAMPMGAALVLGLVVGHHLRAADAGVQLADLLTYNTSSVADF